MMPSEKVWSRFERKRKNGEVMKLRIQDLPADRLEDALDLIIDIFVREEVVYKAVDAYLNATVVQLICQYYNQVLRDPSCRAVICCSDETDDVKDIIGLSMMRLSKENMAWIEIKYLQMLNKPEMIGICGQNLIKILHEMEKTYNPIKEYKLDIFFDDEGAFVVPDYRGLGIADQFLKARRNMCIAYKVPMTGAWMTAHGSQKAAALDGWETVCEISYDYLAKKFDVDFVGAPPTMKFMICRVPL